MMEEAGPAQIRDKEHVFRDSWSQGDVPDYTGTERLNGGQKGGRLNFWLETKAQASRHCGLRRPKITSMWCYLFYLLSGQAQPAPSSSFYGVSAINIMEFLSTGEKLFSLGPMHVLPQHEKKPTPVPVPLVFQERQNCTWHVCWRPH